MIADPPGTDDPWATHRAAQMAAWARATPDQLLAWLEEMLALAHACGALPRPRPDPWADPEQGPSQSTR